MIDPPASRPLRALLALVCLAGPALAGPPSPARSAAPSAAASPKATATAEEVPEAYLKVLADLRSRAATLPTTQPSFRFWRIDVVQWPVLQIKEITTTARGPAVLLDGTTRPYYPGDALMGTRLVSIGSAEIVLELAGEKRTFNVKRGFPDLTVRSIREVEGEWTVFVEGERRALYVGDTVREARILKIEPDGATVQFGSITKKLTPKLVRPPFPAVPFTGIIQQAGGRVLLIKGRRDPLGVGDVYEGVKVIEIGNGFAVLEFEKEKRTVPIR